MSRAEWRRWAEQSLMLALAASSEFERQQRMLDYERGMIRAKELDNADSGKGK